MTKQCDRSAIKDALDEAAAQADMDCAQQDAEESAVLDSITLAGMDYDLEVQRRMYIDGYDVDGHMITTLEQYTRVISFITQDDPLTRYEQQLVNQNLQALRSLEAAGRPF